MKRIAVLTMVVIVQELTQQCVRLFEPRKPCDLEQICNDLRNGISRGAVIRGAEGGRVKPKLPQLANQLSG